METRPTHFFTGSFVRRLISIGVLLLGLIAVPNHAHDPGPAAVADPHAAHRVAAEPTPGPSMPGMVMSDPPAEAFVARAAPLPATGWVATASDQQSTFPAGNVLDRKPATIWHSRFTAPAAPLPHSITIDMRAAKSIKGLTYQGRQDGSRNGNVGRFSISVSDNGTAWGSPVATGTWGDTTTVKTAAFVTVSARYIRLTAITEAGNRGPWSSAAEITVIGTPAVGPALPRAGWTASAGDQAVANPAGNVLDGNATTIWHSLFSPAVPLPHAITIDMKATRRIGGLTYLPRADASSNGNVGRYSISVSVDGSTWQTPVANATWADDKSAKTVAFAQVDARYVRLTATTEAGNRGPWSSASEIEVHGSAPAAGAGGRWGPPIGFPAVPVTAVLLPNNKLLTFAANTDRSFDKIAATTIVSILDLTTGLVSAPSTINTQHQMFCSGLAILADGRVLINGGSTNGATTIYNPANNTWTKGPRMQIPRAYHSSTLLSDRRVFTIGGSWYDSAGNKNGEVFTPSGSTGTWAKLTGVPPTRILTADPGGVFRSDNHAWLFAISGGAVFQAGPSKQMNWITTSGAGTIVGAGNRADSADAMNGNAVMYDVGRILTFGGATAYQDVGTVKNVQATRRAYTVDIRAGRGQPVVTTRVGDLAYARAYGNGVVLPDGTVLALGGQQHPQSFTDTAAPLSPELWDPATGDFTLMAPEVEPRTYHSVALLLPDGRVFSGGGGLCGNCATNHANGQIFTPPYLLNADGSARVRPTITTAPATARPGATITVTTGAAVPRFALVRTSAVTHTVNTDQRRIPLTPTSVSGTSHTLQIPADTGVALPGDYLLFALDAQGTPSVAKFIRIN
jgi:galactose oxidase